MSFNIVEYSVCLIDYLFIRTHASGQLAYNPIEHSIAMLSQKLAGITLPIDKHGSHFNSQGQVVNLELAMKNMHYAGKALCALWNRDPIFGRPVTTQYIDQKSSPF
ncbi:10679_t:CDS:1, partial [Funneliformis geosporum]